MKFKLPTQKKSQALREGLHGQVIKQSSKERKDFWKMLSKTVSYPDNELYIFVTERLKELSQEHPYKKILEIQTQPTTMVLSYMSYDSTATTLSFPFGHITIHSRAKSLDISRVIVDQDNHGKGLGTLMMSILMHTIVLYIRETEKFPKVILECSGLVGLGKNRQETPLHQQVKFFEKFGFELERVKDGYHHMILTLEGIEDYTRKIYLSESFAEPQS